MFTYTSQMIARVLERDAEERAGAGGTVRMTKAVHRTQSLGYKYSSGKPALAHFVDFHFSDGSIKTYGSASSVSLSSPR